MFSREPPASVTLAGGSRLNEGRSAQLLLLEQLIEPLAIFIAQRGAGIAAVINLGGEAALIVTTCEGRVQIEDSIAVIGGERKAETRQTLLQRRRVDLVAFRLGGARHGDGVIPVRQSITRVLQ